MVRTIVSSVVRRAIAPVMGRLRLSRAEWQDPEKADNADRGQHDRFLVRHSHGSHAGVKVVRHSQLHDEWPEPS